MDPPSTVPTTTPILAPTPTTTTTTTTSPTSPPKSRATDSDDLQPYQPPQQPPQTTTKLRLMCSYGGHIVPRPHTKSLCYINGDTRMIVIDRTTTLSDLLTRLSLTLPHPPLHKPFTLKYQLPNEDLDSLITVSTDEDLDNMIDEYDRLNSNSNPNCKPGRIRLFLFPVKPDGAQSMGNMLDGSGGSDDWFLNALNSGGGSGNSTDELRRGFSDPNSVDCLLGLDRDVVGVRNPNFGNSDSNGNFKGEIGEKVNLGNLQDVQSVPESPMIETTSSFGSTASSPTMANMNLPQIRVHVDEGSTRVSGDGGIEEQFAQMGVNGGGQGVKRVDEGFVVMSSPPGGVVVGGFTGVVAGGGGGEFGNRVYVEDERLKQQQQQVGGQGGGGVGGVVVLNSQQKPQLSAELPSPDSVSSDSSLSSAIARQRQVIYQDPSGQLSSGGNRFPPGAQVQQVSESGYALHPQFDLYQQQMLHRHQQQQFVQQQHQAQTQQQTQTQPQAPQQYIPAGAHFVHHHPSGAVPMPAYYYPAQPMPNHPHQYPVYYVPAGQAQAQSYSLPAQQQPIIGGQQQPIMSGQQQPIMGSQQQPNIVGQSQTSMGEAPTSVAPNRTQTPPNPALVTTSAYNPTQNINMQAPNPEMGPGVYTTTTGPGVPKQQQYVTYSQIHHPPQPVVQAPNTVPASGYAYEFSDPARPQIYYTQPQAPVLASQYQGMTSSGGTTATMMMPDGSSQLPNDSVKQQTGSSQPL